uniref:Uncharacterized protein n=1 Tax=Physcomitrium patens TaxID=3218 RepID=A0A2K1L980_PHYPA|nr:hypothetical protein PHYPA_000996 [Physcomitrium patens]
MSRTMLPLIAADLILRWIEAGGCFLDLLILEEYQTCEKVKKHNMNGFNTFCLPNQLPILQY